MRRGTEIGESAYLYGCEGDRDRRLFEGCGRKGGSTILVALVLVNTVILCSVVGYVFFGGGRLPGGESVEVRLLTDEIGADVTGEMTVVGRWVDGAGQGGAGSPLEIDAFQSAQGKYQAGEMKGALEDYRAALGGLEDTAGNRWIAEFIRFRIAGCAESLGDADRAVGILGELVNCRSWIVALASRYALGRIAYSRGRYLEARALAYGVLAQAQVLPGSEQLERDAHYLAAAALTRRALVAGEGAASRVFEVLGTPRRADVLDSWDGEEIGGYLTRGKVDYASRMVARRVSLERGDGGRFDIAAHGAALEEVLRRIASATGYEVSWDGIGEEARRSPVHLYLTGASAAVAAEFACACAGLFVRSVKGGVSVADAGGFREPEEGRSFMIEEALAAWRSYFLERAEDEGTPRGYFAVAGLEAGRGGLAAAVTQFRLLVQRYPRSPAAPPALLAGAELLGAVRDYEGASEMLMELIDSYPRSRAIGEAYLELGNARWEEEDREGALGMLKKAAYMESDPEVTRRAVLELGRRTLAMGKDAEAKSWLGHYCETYGQSPETAEAFLLLGEALAGLDEPEEAAGALGQAWQLDRGGEIGAEALLLMAGIERERERYVVALNALETAVEGATDEDRLRRAALLKAGVLRDMGLGELAVEVLRRELAGGPPEGFRVELAIELADVLEGIGGRQADALGVLTETMLEVQSPERRDALELAAAGVYLRQGKHEEAATFAKGVLSRGRFEDRGEALGILARAYSGEGDYRKAALCLAGAWEGEE